jgi:hypothetical protein
MGGFGSTRWNNHAKKYQVEQCLSLDANHLMREGILQEDAHRHGFLYEAYSITSEKTYSLGYEVDTTDMGYPWIRLFYTIKRTGENVVYKILLTTTQPNFGGLRYWFICPLCVSGRVCCKRVRKLYLPHYAKYYGCRHCYDLAYRSSQESDKRVYWLRRNPEALIKTVRNRDRVDPSKLFLAMKALKRRFL